MAARPRRFAAAGALRNVALTLDDLLPAYQPS